MVFISSCQPKPGCMEAIKAGLRKYGKFENIIETDIGTTIGGYSGPGTIGIVFALLRGIFLIPPVSYRCKVDLLICVRLAKS